MTAREAVKSGKAFRWWKPTFPVPRSDGPQGAASIEDARLSECPVSYITPKSKRLVQLFAESEGVREEAGQHPFGDPSTWPAAMADAAVVIQFARARVRVACERA